MNLRLRVGPEVITSYQRLAYSPWHALAEYVDNSTQCYANSKDELDRVFKTEGSRLEVAITYNRDVENGFLRISDNAMGMSYQELEDALCLAKKPAIDTGRSRYGLGLKTASCWFGNNWVIRTKKLNEPVGHIALINVQDVALGKEVEYRQDNNVKPEDHYTVIEITDHVRKLHGRTTSKIRDFLRSMYRVDISERSLVLKWQDETLQWTELSEELMKAADGKPYKHVFAFQLSTGEETLGWVGILEKGSRAKAGFSILHRKRVVRGWPLSWRPGKIYGQLEGSNDLINQRLVGEIYLDDFDVSHTKDDILWRGNQEAEVEDFLFEECKAYRDIARQHRKGHNDQRRPSEIETRIALERLEQELLSEEMVDTIEIEDVPPQSVVDDTFKQLDDVASSTQPDFDQTIGSLRVRIYLSYDLSPNDPYIRVDSKALHDALVIINMNHPYLSQIKGSNGALNYYRECTFDAIAEHKARHKGQRTDPDTIKLIKDDLLRIPFEMEGSNEPSTPDENDANAQEV